jgi:hypothetical protein
VHDREEGDGARHRGRRLAAGRLQGLELASFGAVDDIPSAGAQLFTEGVGGDEVALPPEQDALREESLGAVSV